MTSPIVINMPNREVFLGEKNHRSVPVIDQHLLSLRTVDYKAKHGHGKFEECRKRFSFRSYPRPNIKMVVVVLLQGQVQGHLVKIQPKFKADLLERVVVFRDDSTNYMEDYDEVYM